VNDYDVGDDDDDADDNDDDEYRRKNIHVLRAIRTHGLSFQTIRAYTSDHATTGTGNTFSFNFLMLKILLQINTEQAQNNKARYCSGPQTLWSEALLM
jgi:hypothetical protein